MGDSLITAGILAVVALSEGVRRLEPGTLVLERPGTGRWRVARTLELGSGLHLVSWCIPWTVPVILAGPAVDAAPATLTARMNERFASVRRHVAWLRVVGALVLIVLIAGVPYGASHWSGLGLLGALALLLLLTATQAVLTRASLLRAGATRRRALGDAIRMMWPFSAPRAPEIVLEQAIDDAPPLVVARALLGDEDLLRTMRRTAYDAVRGADAPEAHELLALFDVATLRTFIQRPVESDGHPFCRRCGTVYRHGVAECADCAGVRLTRNGAGSTG